MTLKKRIAAAVCCAMVLSASGYSALAADTGAAAVAAEGASGVEMGGAVYATLADAIAQAGAAPAEIKLLGDLTVSETITIGAEQDITLDLGNYTLTTTLKGTYDQSSIDTFSTTIDNNGKLTIVSDENGQFIGTSSDNTFIKTSETGSLTIGREGDRSFPTLNSNNALLMLNNGGDITVNSATLIAGGSTSGGYAFWNNSGTITVKSATISGSVTALIFSGTATFDKDAAIETNDFSFGVQNGTLNLNGCTVNYGKFSAYNANVNITGGSYHPTFFYNEAINETTFNITGGTFADASISKYISDDYTITEDGTVVPIAPAVTVSTRNASQATGTDGSLATGFVTTINGNDAFSLETIEWAVTYADETQTTEKYDISNITLGGNATIGLIVNGFADANASAKATVNSQISE